MMKEKLIRVIPKSTFQIKFGMVARRGVPIMVAPDVFALLRHKFITKEELKEMDSKKPQPETWEGIAKTYKHLRL